MAEPYTIAIAGIAALSPISEPCVADAIKRLCEKATRFVFALDGDVATLALVTAARWLPHVERHVVVRGTVAELPHVAQDALRLFECSVDELGLEANTPGAAQAHAERLLDGAQALLAFTSNAHLFKVEPGHVRTQPEIYRRVEGVANAAIVRAALQGLTMRRFFVERF